MALPEQESETLKILLFNPPLYGEKYYTEAEECCFGLVGRPVVPHHLLRIASALRAERSSLVTFKDYAIERQNWNQTLADMAGYDLAVTSAIHGATAHARYMAFYEPLHHQKNLVVLCYPEGMTEEIYAYLRLDPAKLAEFKKMIPDFAREIKIDYAGYPYHNVAGKVYVVQAATGCRYNCNFCVWAGHRFVIRPPQAVIDQLVDVATNMAPRDAIFLLSSQITGDKAWLKTFVELKEKLLPNLVFQGDIGIGEVDLETAKLLARAKIENATIGAEALSDGWLRRFRKAWTYESIKRGLLNLQAAGVEYHLILRCGIGETTTDVAESIRNLTELVALGIKPSRVVWGKIYPYPGTDIAHMEGKQEFIPELKLYVDWLRQVGWIKR